MTLRSLSTKPDMRARDGDAATARRRVSRVTITALDKSFGGAKVVDSLSLAVEAGEFLVLVGPSGCGKTTTMRSIAGLETPDSGRIEIGDRVVFDSAHGVNVRPNKRDVGLVFQSYAIWPHKTVQENVSFPLKVRKASRREITQRTAEILEIFGLAGLADRGASLLSGGQMQRVALARSIIMAPRVLLLDEPLSNVDAKLRERLRSEIKRTQQRFGITTIHVTHDQSEALALADRVAVMRDGRIEQIGTPESVYRQPATTFVAEFMGSCNLLPVEVLAGGEDGSRLRISSGEQLSGPPVMQTSPQLVACIRPETIDIRPVDPASNGQPVLRGAVETVAFMGDHFAYEVRLRDGTSMRAMERSARAAASPGDDVALHVVPSDIHLVAQ